MASDAQSTPQPAAAGTDVGTASASATPSATPVNPETALLLACANLLSQHCQSVPSSSLSLHLPVLVDLLGRGSGATQSIQEFPTSNPDTLSPARKRQRLDQTHFPSEVPFPSAICAAAVDGLESLVKLAATRPQAILRASSQPPESASHSDRPVSYVTLDATGTHWIISTPVQGGLLRHFLPPVESRLDELVAVEPAAFDSQARGQSLPSSTELVSTASVFEDTDGQRLREGSDPPFGCFTSEQAFTADVSPVSEHTQEESVSAPPIQPVSGDLSGGTADSSSTLLTDTTGASQTLEEVPGAAGAPDGQKGRSSTEASLANVSPLETYWATSQDPSWVAADVLRQPHLPVFCRNTETDSVEMCHSVTSDKGSTTRTCCTEDEFPLDGEKAGTTEPYSEMAKKLPKLAGVIFDRVHARWVSTYHDKETRKVMRKYFGVRKHGFEQAYKMAVRHRKMKLMSKQNKNEPEKAVPGVDSTVGCLAKAASFFDGEADTMNKNVCYETLFKTLPRVTGVSYDSYAMKFRAGFMSNGKWNVKDFPIRKYGTFAEAYRRAVACRLGNSRVESSRKTEGSPALRGGDYAVQS